MSGPMITVMQDRYPKAWPAHEQGERVYTIALGKAMARSYSTDAHFAAYVTPNARRLSTGAVDHGPVTLNVITFDVDCPETHGGSEPASESWRANMRAKMHALAEVHANPYYYETKGGARFLYAQPTPTVLATRDDVRTWKQDYAISLCYLARRFGISADPSCSDWTRLFRLPRATRDGKRPESWLTVGDPNNVGALCIEPTDADLAAAKRLLPNAFREARMLDFAPANDNGGEGLLFHLLRRRGDIVRGHGHAFVIRCPRESEHTCGRTGDGSTLLYRPAQGEVVGMVWCLHSHCQSMRARDWLRCFTARELTEARRAAGIERVA